MPERLVRLEAIFSQKRWDFVSRLHGFLPPRRSFLATLIAFALLLGALALKILADDWADARLPPFIFLYPAVVLSALVAGVRTSMIIVVLSVLIAWVWYFLPFSSFELHSPLAVLSLEIYAASAIFLALTVGFARQMLDLAIASEELRDYDAQEAIHRIKNLLAVVQAITIGSLKDTDTLDEYRHLISKRLDALAGAQNVLRRHRDAPISVEDLAQAALSPFLPNGQITVDCEAQVLVPARYVHGLTLALFELATNSAKYGALSRNEGEIVLACRREAKTVALEWRESVPGNNLDLSGHESHEGFGARLVQVALRRDSGTEVLHEQANHHVTASFKWPE